MDKKCKNCAEFKQRGVVLMKVNKLLKKIIFVATFGLVSLALTSCASIVSGQNQPVSVSTPSVKGATCQLENNKGKWFIPSTPGSVTVQRSYHDLHVTCEKSGYRHTEKNVASSTKGMAFGNILFGGVIGAGVDMADGAAYDYPTDIQLDMQKTRV
jgi:hypothetical protein